LYKAPNESQDSVVERPRPTSELHPQFSAGIGRYSMRCVPLDGPGETFLSEWQSFHRQYCKDSPMHDPEWLKGYFDGQTNNLFVYSLYQSGSLCGLAPFLLRDWPLKWYLGELAVAKFPLRRFRLLGGTLAFPDDEAACDALFSEVVQSNIDFDMLQLEEIPIDSFLWNYLHHSKLVRELFLSYQPELPSPHPVLRFRGSFEQYMGKFNSKHRNTLRRKLKKLREGALGQMRLARFETPQEVSAFLEQAVKVSRKTYQWT
jgi:hypothetical protein